MSGYREPENKRPRYSERELASFAEHSRTQSQTQQSQAISLSNGEPRKASPPSSTASTQHNPSQPANNGDEIPGMMTTTSSMHSDTPMAVDASRNEVCCRHCSLLFLSLRRYSLLFRFTPEPLHTGYCPRTARFRVRHLSCPQLTSLQA